MGIADSRTSDPAKLERVILEVTEENLKANAFLTTILRKVGELPAGMCTLDS